MESDILDRSQEASMDENQGPAKRRIPPEAVDLYTRTFMARSVVAIF
jgi:hypothetical protein